jgi:hypothetical protein
VPPATPRVLLNRERVGEANSILTRLGMATEGFQFDRVPFLLLL